MSAKDKSGLGYGDQIHKGVLSYENEVLESVFDSRSSDVENSPVNDRFANVVGMHAVPPPMIGIYMPPKFDFGIDESMFTYSPKQSKTSQNEAETSDFASCESNSNVETLESVPQLAINEPKVVSEPKVWSDAPIIEEYESDSDDEYVIKPSKEQEKPRDPKKYNGGSVASCRKDRVKINGKKNKVLFTDSECLVLSPDFKLPDDNQVLLRVPRKNNMDIIEFCGSKGIKREYSNARTPQQNRVAKRKNRTLIEAARTMLADSFLPNTFWAEAVSTACYVLNRVLVTKPQNKTPYELITGKIPIISYIRPFGCHVTILNTIDHLGKFEEKSDEGFLVGYSLNSKAFRVYNLETKRVEENLHINFLENKPNVAGKEPNWLFIFDYLTDSMNYQLVTTENRANKTAGPKEANHSAVKSSKAKNGNEKPNRDTGPKTNDEPKDQEDQAFLKELERLKRQEKEANDAAKAFRKEFAQCTEDLLLQAGAARATNTNTVNIVSTPISTASPSRVISAGGPDLTNNDQDDSQIPALKDIYDNPSDGIFTNASYNDEGAVADFTNLETTVNVSPIPTLRIHSIHPTTQILRDPTLAVQTRSKEELLQFKIQKVWILVDLPFGKRAIRTKWVYKNKKDERGVVVRNKSRLVAQGYRQEEWIDYDDVFALVAQIEAIRIFLAFASYMGFIFYQMDVKSAFLYSTINEEMYVSQSPGFVDPKFPKKVYKVIKALYGLHQAPKAWYATLSTFLLKSGYIRGTINKTLFIKKDKNDIILMSSMGELTFFLGLLVKQKKDGIFISQDKYVAKILKKFDFTSMKTASTPIETQKSLTKDEEATDVDVHLYISTIGSLMYLTASSTLKANPNWAFGILECHYLTRKPTQNCDYAGANLDRKSTTIEAEYVAAANCCRQVLWIQNQMLDYGFNFLNTKIYIDNESTICIVKNPMFYSKIKHIEIRHHFIRDAYEKKLIQVLKIHTDDNVADILTKAFDVSSSQTVNDEKQIHATVDSKAVVVNEASIRSSLLLNDADEVEESEGSEQPTEPQPTPSPTQPRDQVQLSNDSPHLGGNTSKRAEGGLNLEELLSLCTNFSNMVLALETAKDAQAVKILKLKTRIKKLEKKLGKKEPVSKQGRKNVKPGPTLDAFDDLDADLAHGMDYMDIEKAVTEGRQRVSTTFNISTASRPEVSTATPMTSLTTTSVFEDEDIFLADGLVMLSDKAKLKGVEIKEKKDDERPARSVLTLKLLPKIDPKDKGKGVFKEEPKPVQAELDEEARLERQRQEQASLNYIANLYDEVQARIDADHELAVKWTQEEQEKYTVDERAKLLAEYFENRKKQFAEERAATIRNKPPTKSQMRSLMMTYLKHTDFVPIGSEEDERLIQKMNKKVAGEHEEKVLEEPDSTKVEVKQEGNKESTRKRPGRRLKMKATKKSRMQKTGSDLEKEEHLKTFLKLVPDEEGIIDYEVLEKRFPIINWESKFYHLDRHRAECIYYRIFRSDESSRWIKTFSEMVTRFDRLDLEELYNLVMHRFESTTLEGVDLVLWGDLRTVFDANTEDELWQNQERWNLKSWNFYENCGVHTLTLEDGTGIHMLAERKYLLIKETLERMMSLKLITESTSESAYNLLSKELASLKQTALGKDISNLFIVDSLLKTIWLSMHLVIAMKHWLFQSKRLLNPPYKFKWTEKTVLIAEGSSETTTEGYMENYKNVSQDIRNQLDAEAEAEFGKFTSRDGESLESYYSRFYKMMNELVRNQCDVTNHQVNVQFLLQLQPELQRNRGKAIINSPPPIYDQEPTMVAENDKMSKEKEIDKLMALISLSFKKIYKPTNNNLRTSSNTSREIKIILHRLLILLQLVEIILFIINSGCLKHMTGNLKLLSNFVEKFLGMVKFGNDQIAPRIGYGDLVQGNITIKRVYYVEGLNHNLFFVGQFCDADLEVDFRKSTCYVRDLKGNDLLIATSSQLWLWHRRLSHLNFDSINLLSKNDIVIGLPNLKFIKDHLCSSCDLGKAKRKSFHTKTTLSFKRWLQLLHMDLCGPMRIESINGKKYVLVIVDEYFRYTWTRFLRSKDETSEVLINFLRLVQRGLHAQLEFLFSPMFDELLNGPTQVVSKSFAINATDAHDKHQQQNITQSTTTTVAANIPPLNIQTTLKTTTQAPTVTATENINQAETNKENAYYSRCINHYMESYPGI
ncbi:putative ribonuclease H-like domain-containing protein [Tanacetum coccineum]